MKIGAVTIGQSPRVDVTPDIMPIFGEQVELIQAGALDGLSREEIERMAPKEDDLCSGVEVERWELCEVR